ncbi:GNAT family N-acetyltransferase [Paucibacter sp. AS339]|uniref:GNAT family N-acetyltransferase n=1 Tax=Paucibacter hankyongi TaxID=3133434 RepID=UPI0030B155FE
MTAVELHAADTQAQLDCIETMMQYFNYELSAWYPIEFTTEGRMPVSPKAALWATAGVRPFLIHVGQALAGFAVVDTETQLPGSQHNMAYFFVTRRYRGSGVGRLAAQQLFARFPGIWEVYYLQANEAAAGFWPRAIAACVGESYTHSTQAIDGEDCQLFRFETTA